MLAVATLDHLTNAVRQAVERDAWYPALSLALALPDICGYIEYGHGHPEFRKSSERRYVDWFDRFLAPDFTHAIGSDCTPTVFLSGADCYALRCSFLHQGADDISGQRARDVLQKFVFIAGKRQTHMNRVNISLNGAPSVPLLQLHVAPFCETICQAVAKWGATILTNQAALFRADTLLSVHTETFSFMGIRFEVD